MTGRSIQRTLPAAPSSWDHSSRDTWNKLISILESSELFDKGRRTREKFIVKTTISAVTTLDLSAPEVTALAYIMAKLLVALNNSGHVDVRTTVA